MFNSRLIPAGSVIERTYLAIPTVHGIGPEFLNTDAGWNAAVEHIRTLIADASTSTVADALAASLRIDVRWVIGHPDGSATDVIAERTAARDCRKTTETGGAKAEDHAIEEADPPLFQPCPTCLAPLGDGEVFYGTEHEQAHSALLDVCVDATILDFIEWLNREGVPTMFSCEECPQFDEHVAVVIPFSALGRWLELMTELVPWVMWSCSFFNFNKDQRIAISVPAWMIAWQKAGSPALETVEKTREWGDKTNYLA